MSLTALIFVIAFAAGCLAAFMRHPVYGLMTYIGVFYIHPPSRWWGQGILLEVRWSFIAAAVALLAVLVRKPLNPTAPLFKSGAFWGFSILVAWVSVQSFWALDPDVHRDLLSFYLKFLIVMYLFCKAIDSEESLKLVLWTHVLGCFYLGWIAFTSYSGGRFEGFGGPGLGDANAASLQLVTGVLTAGTLFLATRSASRVALVGIIVIIVNAMVTTISRSGFLATGIGGLIYNFFTPRKYRRRVTVLSVLALVMFALLTNPIYWARMSSLKYKGQEIEGIDTGGGRLVIIAAQWRMFKAHPMGCGHMCTTVLSPSYLEADRLSQGARASHNTFMTMLVDHGIPGGAFYLAMMYWIYRNLRIVAGRLRGDDGFLATVLPAVAAVLGAIAVGDLFVQYPKFEARVWFVSLLIVLLHLTANRESQSKPA